MGKNEKKKKLSVLYFHQIGGPWFHLGWPIMFGNIGGPQARHPIHEYHSSFCHLVKAFMNILRKEDGYYTYSLVVVRK